VQHFIILVRRDPSDRRTEETFDYHCETMEQAKIYATDVAKLCGPTAKVMSVRQTSDGEPVRAGVERKRLLETIDCTPSWQEVLPALITMLQEGSAETKSGAMTELMRMARLADAYNVMQKAMTKALEDTTTGLRELLAKAGVKS